MIDWDNNMRAYFFWDEADIKQGYWDNKEDAIEAFEIYCKKLMEE
tara:strand:+ start:2106 stop:2240 length:135 start_codon:yes stop_codon:yes gene_type:complete